MRALAACSVLIYHSWLYSAPNQHTFQVWPVTLVLPDFAFGGVLFFTLSGFLLCRPFVVSTMRGIPLPSARGYLRNERFGSLRPIS